MSTPRYGLARILSKRGLASRTQASELIRAGSVRVDGRCIRDPEHPTQLDADIRIDDKPATAVTKRYLAYNKPRGLIVSQRDEKSRRTIFEQLPNDLKLSAVGRLDQASEGLLLVTNDTVWAARITEPDFAVLKTYHVQINRHLSEHELKRMTAGIPIDGDFLRAHAVEVLRAGEKTCWLAMTLDEGKNRHIRRMLDALECEVLRLLRVQIGSLKLGELAKGQWRELSDAEIEAALQQSAGPAKR
jgi:23S rRNA pseudouridine2605 synthase